MSYTVGENGGEGSEGDGTAGAERGSRQVSRQVRGGASRDDRKALTGIRDIKS